MPEMTPLPAATVTLVRDTARGLEVLLLQRNHESGFMPGMFLFPGGAVDPEDAAPEMCERCRGLDEQRAGAMLGTAERALAYWTAAIRECFEEAGVLLAYGAAGGMIKLDDAEIRSRYAAYRAQLNAGKHTFVDVLRAEGLQLAVDRLTYFSHWITPVGAPRRYDTRFFVAAAPAEQDALHDNRETIHHVWMAPGAALDRYRRGEYKMRSPTVKTLEDFAAYDTGERLIAAMRERRDIPAILPRINERGERVLPGDPRYDAAAGPGAQGKWKP